MSAVTRKIARMHEMFGMDPSHKCGECSNFVSGMYMSKILRKCRVYGLTHSQAGDWAKSWTACGMFNREYARLDFAGFEIDPDYFKAQEERYAVHISKMSLFV